MFGQLVVLKPGVFASCLLAFYKFFTLFSYDLLQPFRKPALCEALPDEGHNAKPVFSNTSWCSWQRRLCKKGNTPAVFLNC